MGEASTAFPRPPSLWPTKFNNMYSSNFSGPLAGLGRESIARVSSGNWWNHFSIEAASKRAFISPFFDCLHCWCAEEATSLCIIFSLVAHLSWLAWIERRLVWFGHLSRQSNLFYCSSKQAESLFGSLLHFSLSDFNPHTPLSPNRSDTWARRSGTALHLIFDYS
jgi:hypothetical protein